MISALRYRLRVIGESFVSYAQYFGGALTIYLVSRVVVIGVMALTQAHGFGAASLEHWDARSYLSIATHGYQFHGAYVEEGTFIAFFPLYPLLVHGISWLTSLSVQTAAFLFSLIIGGVAVCLLYSYARSCNPSERAALTATALLSFFPTSVFLSSAYTEGLFLTLTLGTLLALRHRASRTATLLTAFAIVTRITGVVLVPILAWSLWRQHRSLIYVFLSLTIAAVPIIMFLGYQWDVFGTPFAFLKAQELNWHHHATWPWNGVWSVLRPALHGSSSLAGMWRTDTLMLTMMLVTLVIGWRKVPSEAMAFGWGVYLLTMSQSYILGTSRYMMMVIPWYLLWPQITEKKESARLSMLALSAGWMAFNTLLFVLSKNIY